MTKRRRIFHADKIIQNVVHVFCLLMFLQLKDYYTIAGNPMLLYSTASDIRIANVSKTTKISVIIKGLQQGSAVDFLYTKSLICWSDQTAELIQCSRYNDTHIGEQMRIVTEGLISPTGIAIDWYTDNIYWTDGETNRIEVISLVAKHRKVLFWNEVDLARAIAVAPQVGLMFWTDWGEVPKIERAGMDGDPSTRRIIVKTDIFWPNGITIDYNSNSIYWVDAKLKFVDVIDFDGNKRRRIVKKGLLEYPYALAFLNNKLYWTDWQTWAIFGWDIATNGPMRELIKSEPVPVDIKVHDASRQLPPPGGEHACRRGNGGCSHLCLLSPSEPGYRCSCPTGVRLRAGSAALCHARPQALLLVAARAALAQVSLDSPDYSPRALPLKDLRRVQTVDYDPVTEFIYWADGRTISRARLEDGGAQAAVLRAAGAPDSLAVDAAARQLYWTDPVTDTISVARLDGSCRKVLIHEDLYAPRAIALHPAGGWMFWSDWDERRPKIERAALDGSGRALVAAERLAWPNGIALDAAAGKIYWGDARTHVIEVANMDGTGRRELLGSDILHIFGLTLLGDYLYWTDMQRRTMERINKNTGLERQVVVEQMANMLGARGVARGEPAPRSACSDGGCGCSHFCFARPAGGCACDCPLGLELKNDRKTCVEPGAFLVYSRKNYIGRISIENENNDAIYPIKDLKEVSALAVHPAGGKIYWADSRSRSVSRVALDGSGAERLLEWTYSVEGLAIDWAAQNMYWTDSVAQRVEVARLDGSSRRALLWQGLKRPKSIALDPRRGYMYWSELGSKTIKRAGMDGSAPSVLLEQVGRVHSLAVDPERRALCWAALDPPALECAALDGGGRRALLAAGPMPYALDVHGDQLYWADWDTGVMETCRRADGSARRVVHTGLDYISDVKVFEARRARDAAGNQCAVDNGGCRHLCLALPAGAGGAGADYRCACPAHYRLNRDNLTCSEPEEFLLFAQKSAVGRVVWAGGAGAGAGAECPDAFIPLAGLGNVRAIEYDPVDKLLYWMDEDTRSIRRAGVSYSRAAADEAAGAGAGALVGDLPRPPCHVALDALGRALYWACAGGDAINATAVRNASLVAVVVRGDAHMPRHLAFHQTLRYLVWNDVGVGAIMRSGPDGAARVELARAANATALAVDQAAAAVYWAVNGKIHAVDIAGANRRTVWQGGWAGSLAVLGDALYFANGERALMRVQLAASAPASAPASASVPAVAPAPAVHVARLVARLVLSVHRVPTEHPCAGGRACGGAPGACGAGGACSERRGAGGGGGGGAGAGPGAARGDAALRDAPECGARQFACGGDGGGGPRCIPGEWACDGAADCARGEDEAPRACGACAGGVRCADGACAPSLGGCDAGAFCLDHPLPDAFRCDGRLCLAPRLLCDGRAHCDDGADEAPAVCFEHRDAVGGVGGGEPAGPAAASLPASRAYVVCGSVGGCAAGALAAWAARRWWRRPPRARRARPPRKPAPPALAAAAPLHVLRERAPPLGASSTESSVGEPVRALPAQPAAVASHGQCVGRRQRRRVGGAAARARLPPLPRHEPPAAAHARLHRRGRLRAGAQRARTAALARPPLLTAVADRPPPSPDHHY